MSLGSSQEQEDWNQHVGEIWLRVLRAGGLSREATIIEIGPGVSDKIARGLRGFGYRGELFVVEPNEKVLSRLLVRYRALLPAAKIVPVGETMLQSISLLPRGVDALIMNHLLDDLALDSTLAESERGPLFAEMRPGFATSLERVRDLWERAWDKAITDGEIIESIADQVRSFVLALSPRWFGASQYESWNLVQNGLSRSDQIGAGVLDALSAMFPGMLDRDREILLSERQDPSRWLCVAGAAPDEGGGL